MAGSAIAAEQKPVLIDGWVREAPPTAKVLAGFGRLHNPADRALVLLSVNSPDFERVEIHEMSMAGGVMTMRALSRLEIPARSDLVLESGARHLMLIGPRHALTAGDTIEVVLEAEAGASIHAQLVVRAPP
jgi:copper(I)-binding protein